MASQAQQVVDRTPADSPAYRRLTHDDHAAVMALIDQGKTQTAIAQLLGFSQSTISDVVRLYTKRTDLASRYLDAHSLQLAEKIVRDGDSRDAVAVLKGRGVLREQGQVGGVIVQIGISADLSTRTFASETSTVSTPQGQLSGDVESDN